MDIETCMHLLELDFPLTPLEAHRAYRRMVKRWHPDQFAHQPAIHAQAEERLKAINQAYDVVKNHIKKHPVIETRPVSVRTRKKPTTNPTNDPSVFHRPPPKPQAFGIKSKTAFPGRCSQTASDPAPDSEKAPRSTQRAAVSAFERILREAAISETAFQCRRNTSARPANARFFNRRRKKGLRVEGSNPLSAVPPVRPVTKIKPIGE